MIIQSTKRPPPGPTTRLVTRAIDEGSLRRPALIVATDGGRPDILVGARAYRNDRLGDLTGSLTALSRAAATSLFPKQAPLIEGIAFVVGAGPRVERILRDGVSPGDFVDVASLVAGGLTHARNLAAPVAVRGPDDGLRGDPVRAPDAIDDAGAVLGVVARTRSGVMASSMAASPFQTMARAEPRPFADLAKAWGTVNPLIGAGFGLFDVLSDPWFWKSLGEGRKPAPARFRPLGAAAAAAAFREHGGVHQQPPRAIGAVAVDARQDGSLDRQQTPGASCLAAGSAPPPLGRRSALSTPRASGSRKSSARPAGRAS